MAHIASHYIVINLGLRSIRAVLYNDNAEVIDKNWFPVSSMIDHDQVEQDPNEWWSLCVKLLQSFLATHPQIKKTLSSITVTSSACCLVVLDLQGNPLLPSLMVSDKRAVKEANELTKVKKLKTIFTKPNNLAVPSFMFPKILWLKNNQPEIFSQTKYFLSSNDFFIYRLSGKAVTDPLNAEKFYYDCETKSYPPEMLQYVAVKKEQLPDVVEPGTKVGKLTPNLQSQLGLQRPVDIVVTTYDAICAFLGSGVSKPGQASNVCGTVTSVRALSDQKRECQNGILSQSLLGFHISGGSNNIDGGLLEWSKHMFYGDSYPEKYVYKIMGDEAEMSPAGAKGLLFSPYIIGERVPFFDTTTRGIFFGLERYHRRADLIRSIFEASAYMVNDIVQNIEQSGIHIDEIRMSGGLTHTKVACEIRADITGKTIQVIDDIETTALGAYFILLLADKKIPDLTTIDQFVKIKYQFKPNAVNHAMYKQFFGLFKKIYHQNQELMQQRKMLMDELLTSEKHLLENL
jgi:sugar (pentulose or hexulose) kinase